MPAEPELEEVLVRWEGPLATVTLNRPERRNTLGPGMLRDLVAAIRWCREEPAVRVVVLTGAGERAFCAGADLSGFAAGESDLEGHHQRRNFVELFTLMRGLGKPIVGGINGHALAGGLGLACSCDLLIAAENATFGTPEIKVGLWPMMVQAILGRDLPRKVLVEMILLGDRWSAAQMHELGLVSRVVPLSELETATRTLALRLAEASPAVIRLGKDSFYRQEDMDFEAALDYLQGQLTLVGMTEDSKEGARAFLEKRPPRWQGR